MKKSFFTLFIFAILGFTSQSCQTSSDLEDMVVAKDISNSQAPSSSEDVKSKPGGN